MEKRKVKLILATLEFVLRNFVNHKNPDVAANANAHRTNILTEMEDSEDPTESEDGNSFDENSLDETLRMIAPPLVHLRQDEASTDLDRIVKSAFGEQATLFNAVEKPTESSDGSSED